MAVHYHGNKENTSWTTLTSCSRTDSQTPQSPGWQSNLFADVVHVPAQVVAQARKPAYMLRPQFVLFGDSLTQKASDPQGGWAAALAHNYQRKARLCLSVICCITWHFSIVVSSQTKAAPANRWTWSTEDTLVTIHDGPNTSLRKSSLQPSPEST